MSGINLRVNGERLWATLMETAAFGAIAKAGFKRLALLDADRLLRAVLATDTRLAA